MSRSARWNVSAKIPVIHPAAIRAVSLVAGSAELMYWPLPGNAPAQVALAGAVAVPVGIAVARLPTPLAMPEPGGFPGRAGPHRSIGEHVHQPTLVPMDHESAPENHPQPQFPAPAKSIRCWHQTIIPDRARGHEIGIRSCRLPLVTFRSRATDWGRSVVPKSGVRERRNLDDSWATLISLETWSAVGSAQGCVIRNAVHVSSSVIAAGRRHSLGLCADGTVVAAGTGTSGECRVEDWGHVVAVAAGNVHTASNTGRSHSVGLRVDGTVMATGWNGDGQCDVESWRDVTLVAAGWRRTLGLVGDGTVLAAGRLREGACNVSQWREVVGLACGDWHSVGLTADGTVVAVGNDRRGQCAVDTWRDVAAVAAGYLHTVGLTNDGRVLAVGDQSAGACEVSAWRDVVAVAAGSYHTVAVTAAGRVVAVGSKDFGQCDVADWREMVAVAAGSTHTLGLRADGTVVAAGNNEHGQCDITGWDAIRLPD